jgi:hypothetical protein
MTSPLLIDSVAVDVPTTAGIPYSPAIVAAGAGKLPKSVTKPIIFGKMKVNSGDLRDPKMFQYFRSSKRTCAYALQTREKKIEDEGDRR